MNIINKKNLFKLEIKKSVFLSFIYPIKSILEIENIIKKYKKDYFKANHCIYAYSFLEKNQIIYKKIDDGEPKGTAGEPILNVIKKNNLINVVIIVIRYFGGVKLGSSLLTRTYSNCASKVLENLIIEDYIAKKNLKIEVDYKYINLVKNLILNKKNTSLIYENFSNTVLLEFSIPNDIYILCKEELILKNIVLRFIK